MNPLEKARENRRLHAKIDAYRQTVKDIRRNRRETARVLRKYLAAIETTKKKIEELNHDNGNG